MEEGDAGSEESVLYLLQITLYDLCLVGPRSWTMMFESPDKLASMTYTTADNEKVQMVEELKDIVLRHEGQSLDRITMMKIVFGWNAVTRAPIFSWFTTNTLEALCASTWWECYWLYDCVCACFRTGPRHGCVLYGHGLNDTSDSKSISHFMCALCLRTGSRCALECVPARTVKSASSAVLSASVSDPDLTVSVVNNPLLSWQSSTLLLKNHKTNKKFVGADIGAAEMERARTRF